MAEKTSYSFQVDPQWVDFTMRATLSSLANVVLSVAGIDAQHKGFGTDVLNRDNYSWVLLRLALEFDRRPVQYTGLKVTTWVSDYGRMMSTRNFTVEDDEGRVFGRVVSQWCMIDLTTRRPVDLSAPAVAATYTQYLVDAPSPAEAPHRITGIAPQREETHRVVYSDIDFNRHVNTLRYMEMMLDLLPIERFAEERPMRMDLNFQRECRYGQTLVIGHEHREGCELFDVSVDGSSAVRASLEWR